MKTSEKMRTMERWEMAMGIEQSIEGHSRGARERRKFFHLFLIMGRLACWSRDYEADLAQTYWIHFATRDD